MPGELIPVIFFLCVAAVWGLIALTRHKERMTMIEKGLRPEDIKSIYERGIIRVNPLSSLKWGIVFVGVGLAVLLGMLLNTLYFVEEGVYPGLIALFGGIGLITFYLIASKRVQS